MTKWTDVRVVSIHAIPSAKCRFVTIQFPSGELLINQYYKFKLVAHVDLGTNIIGWLAISNDIHSAGNIVIKIGNKEYVVGRGKALGANTGKRVNRCTNYKMEGYIKFTNAGNYRIRLLAGYSY